MLLFWGCLYCIYFVYCIFCIFWILPQTLNTVLRRAETFFSEHAVPMMVPRFSEWLLPAAGAGVVVKLEVIQSKPELNGTTAHGHIVLYSGMSTLNRTRYKIYKIYKYIKYTRSIKNI